MPGDAFRVPARKQAYPRCAPQVRPRGQKALHFNAYFAQPQYQTEVATALEQTWTTNLFGRCSKLNQEPGRGIGRQERRADQSARRPRRAGLWVVPELKGGCQC